MRINQALTAIDLEESRSCRSDAANDGVFENRVAAQDDSGDGETRGQETCDGEEHVEADAGTQKRPMLPGVVLEGAHGPVGVQPCEQEGEKGSGPLRQAFSGTLGMAPVLPLVKKLKF